MVKEINEIRDIIRKINSLNIEIIDLYNRYYILLVKLNKKFKEK